MAELIVVDDDQEIAVVLADILRSKGHGVRVAYDGYEGLALLAERCPDVALVDVEMPVLTGPEMSQRMFVRNAGEESVPIIFVSGIVDLPRVAALAGTPYYLAKPFDVDELLELIERALKERRAPVRTAGSG